MDEIGFEGQTAETKAMEHLDRTSDGTMSFSRAQMCEAEIERDSMAGPRFTQTLTTWDARADLVKRASASPAILRDWSITPLDDRLTVKYASYKEGYVCETCKGVCHSDQVCAGCGGAKSFTVNDFKKCFACDGSGRFTEDQPCSRCQGTGGDSSTREVACAQCAVVGLKGQNLTSTGYEKCTSCSGSGLAPGVTAIPDESQQDHSYGDILSIGSEVYDLRPGDRVLFSKLAGIYIRGEGGVNYCQLRRGEIMGLMLKVAK